MLDIMIPENVKEGRKNFFLHMWVGGGLNTPQRMPLIVL